MDYLEEIPTRIIENKETIDFNEKAIASEDKSLENIEESSLQPLKPVAKNLFSKKIDEKEKIKTAQKCGQTTIQREIVVNLRKIARNLDIIIMLLVVFLTAWTTLNIHNKEILFSIFTGFATLILAFVQILIPKGRWADQVLQKILKKNLDENYRTII
jgi:hypothetical protein